MLVTMKPILDAAREGHYCVPAPNYMDCRQARMCIEAAEEMNSPIILDIARTGDEDEETFKDLAAYSVKIAKEAKVPVAINLDHGSGKKYILQAMHYGCSSVMVDRSWKAYEDNAAEVKELVEIAHAVGCSVEAELGHVGANEGVDGEDASGVTRSKVTNDEERRATFTKPDEAIKFVEETGVDCLAVAVGTVHGLYPKGFKPELDFDLLAELREKISVPLVLHGGSGTGEENLARAAKIGACKLNVGSDLFKAFRDAVTEAVNNNNMNPLDPVGVGYLAYKEELKHYIDFLGAKGKAAK